MFSDGKDGAAPFFTAGEGEGDMGFYGYPAIKDRNTIA
jgi:hypothetical protein